MTLPTTAKVTTAAIRLRRALGAAAEALLIGVASIPSQAGPAAAHQDHSGHQMASTTQRSVHAYTIPVVKVTRADGKQMMLAQAIDDGRPVMLNFIYTSCNTICPVTSQVFVEVREQLGAERERVNMVSISIDPEQDTPGRLAQYAKRFGSAGVWAHYTSSSADAIAIQRAFGAWRGDKMNHQPSTYLRAGPGKPWVQLDGFFGPSALVSEYRMLMHAALNSNRCEAMLKDVAAVPSTAGTHAGTNTKCKS